MKIQAESETDILADMMERANSRPNAGPIPLQSTKRKNFSHYPKTRIGLGIILGVSLDCIFVVRLDQFHEKYRFAQDLFDQ